MSGLKVLVFLSSVRDSRMADRVMKLVTKVLKAKGFVVDVMDPLKENLPLIKNPLHFYPDQSKAPQQLIQLNQKIIFADAFVFITAEYNFGVPPALSNLIDHFPPPSYAFKPASIVSYSAGSGGRNAATHLENSLICLGCLVQPFSVNIPMVQNAVSEDGKSNLEHLEVNLTLLADQLEFTGMAMKNIKQSGKIKQPKMNPFF